MKYLSVVFTIIFALVGSAVASDYNYISQEQLKNDIENDAAMIIVDIQVEDQFQKHHITGSTPTYAYPAKSEADTQKLDAVFEEQQESGKPLVIVCPRGAGGAKRSYDYLKERGVSDDKLLILEKGMGGWPYEELTVTQ